MPEGRLILDSASDGTGLAAHTAAQVNYHTVTFTHLAFAGTVHLRAALIILCIHLHDRDECGANTDAGHFAEKLTFTLVHTDFLHYLQMANKLAHRPRVKVYGEVYRHSVKGEAA